MQRRQVMSLMGVGYIVVCVGGKDTYCCEVSH